MFNKTQMNHIFKGVVYYCNLELRYFELAPKFRCTPWSCCSIGPSLETQTKTHVLGMPLSHFFVSTMTLSKTEQKVKLTVDDTDETEYM